MLESLSIVLGVVGIIIGTLSILFASRVRFRVRSSVETQLHTLVEQNSALQAALQAQSRPDEVKAAHTSIDSLAGLLESKIDHQFNKAKVDSPLSIDYVSLAKKIPSVSAFYHTLHDVYMTTTNGLKNIATYIREVSPTPSPALWFVDICAY